MESELNVELLAVDVVEAVVVVAERLGTVLIEDVDVDRALVADIKFEAQVEDVDVIFDRSLVDNEGSVLVELELGTVLVVLVDVILGVLDEGTVDSELVNVKVAVDVLVEAPLCGNIVEALDVLEAMVAPTVEVTTGDDVIALLSDTAAMVLDRAQIDDVSAAVVDMIELVDNLELFVVGVIPTLSKLRVLLLEVLEVLQLF